MKGRINRIDGADAAGVVECESQTWTGGDGAWELVAAGTVTVERLEDIHAASREFLAGLVEEHDFPEGAEYLIISVEP